MPRTRSRVADDRSAFAKVRRAETAYARKLRKIARQVGEIVSAFPPGDPAALPQMQAALDRYAEALDPWAQASAARMVEEVARRDEQAWKRLAKTMGIELRRELADAPTGQAVQAFMAEQVRLIRSLPIEAGQRVHRLTMEAITTGRRADEIAGEIARSGEVAVSRANLIARTEVARTASALVMARAQYVGSTAYVWRTAHDLDVRPTHRKLEGKVIKWDDPPECDPGHRAHAGMIWNCRCYPEPILPDEERNADQKTRSI